MNEEPLWKACADWFCRLGILPDNHRILWSDASMKDLAYALRDGVLLCHVASTLYPEAVDQKNVNQRPQMAQFLCLKNIKIFLNACRDSFGLKETDLFNPAMLYDYTDFARVLQTLSKLSHSEVAQSKRGDIEGFPKRTRSANLAQTNNSDKGGARKQATKHNQEEEIYR